MLLQPPKSGGRFNSVGFIQQIAHHPKYLFYVHTWVNHSALQSGSNDKFELTVALEVLCKNSFSTTSAAWKITQSFLHMSWEVVLFFGIPRPQKSDNENLLRSWRIAQRGWVGCRFDENISIIAHHIVDVSRRNVTKEEYFIQQRQWCVLLRRMQ